MKKKIVTTQYKIIPIDLELHKKIINQWEEDKLNLKDESKFRYEPDDGYHDLWRLNSNHPLYDLIKFPIPYHEILYLRNPPKVGLGTPHVDGKRGCAFNIPIQVDFNSSLIYTAREECTRLPKSKRLYHYEPEKYDFYNLRQPALINTQNPHGGANFADTYRILLSVSFLESYDFVSTHI